MKNDGRRFGRVAFAATLSLLVFGSGCNIDGTPDAGVVAEAPDAGDGGGGSGGADGGTGGEGGSIPEPQDPQAHPVMDWVAAGSVSKSKQYTIVYSLGQGTIDSGKSTSTTYQVESGLSAANRSLP